MEEKKGEPNLDATPEQMRKAIELAKLNLTEADIKWFENPVDLVPFEDVLQELERFVAERSQGDGA